MFSLLVLFYAKVVTRRDWHSKWKTLANTTYILGNATVCVFTGVWCVSPPRSAAQYCTVLARGMGAHLMRPLVRPPRSLCRRTAMPRAVFAGLADSDATLSLMQSIYLGVAGVLFLLLSAMLATCGCRLTRLGLLETKRMFIFQRKTLVVVNALLTLVFTSRGVYNMLSAVDVSSVDIELDGREDVSMLGAVLFFLWEPFPMMLMLATMAKPTFRSVRTGAHHRPLIPPHGVYREIRGSAGSGSGGASLPPIVMESGRSLVAEDAIHTGTSWGQWGGGLDSSNLFENRHRYDSDQEDEAMEDSDSDYPPAGYSASPVAPLPGPRDGAYGRA